MTWFKVDDRAAFNAKVLRAGNEAFGAWTRAGSWTSAEGKDGFIPDETAELIAKKRVWERAVSAGLMSRVDGGWQIQNYLEYNPSAEQVASKREARAQAGSKGGKRSVEAKAQAIASANVQAVACDTFQPPSRPVPSRPDPSPTETVLSAVPTTSKASPKRTRAPEPDDEDAWCERWKLTAERAAHPDDFAHFLNSHRAKGSLFERWGAAWATWKSQGKKFAAARATAPLWSKPSTLQADDESKLFVPYGRIAS